MGTEIPAGTSAKGQDAGRETPLFNPSRHSLWDIAAVIAVSLWCNCLIMSAIAAALLFPAMKALNPSLPEYQAIAPDQHWLIAAGQPQQEIFKVVDVITIVCMAVCLAATVARLRRRALPRALGALIAVTLLLGIARSAYVMPHMFDDAGRYWSAARAGDMATATPLRERFDKWHTPASRLLSAEAIAALATFVALLATGLPHRRSESEGVA